jgi:hypothetical protein
MIKLQCKDILTWNKNKVVIKLRKLSTGKRCSTVILKYSVAYEKTKGSAGGVSLEEVLRSKYRKTLTYKLTRIQVSTFLIF